MIERPPSGVFDVLDRPCREFPDRVAIVAAGTSLTYAELDRLAWNAAAALLLFGVRRGDRVAASLPNGPDIVAAFHGAMRLGAVWVGINRALAAPEKAFILNDSGASVFLTDGDMAGGAAAWAADQPARVVTKAAWDQALAGATDRPERPDRSDETPLDPFAPAAIAYTSGTTGFPKGAVHCQAGLVMPGAATVARRGWGPGLRKADSFPLTILNMMALTTLLTAQAGGTAILIEGAGVAGITAEIRRQRATVWNGAPAQLHSLVHDPSIEAGDLSSLEEVWVGGGDCPDALRSEFETRFAVPVIRTYGLTEAPALVSIDPIDGPRPAGTSGEPLDHIDVASEDGEVVLTAKECGPWAGCYRPLLGYWNQPEASASVLAGDKLHTGDLGTVEGSGHLRILGRRSQLIIRGGANVYPAEVERVLAEAPGVEACAVVGVADERLGERVAAVIETTPGMPVDTGAIVAHCRVGLAAYKVPERMAFVDRLPRNQMGKVPRDALLSILAEDA